MARPQQRLDIDLVTADVGFKRNKLLAVPLDMMRISPNAGRNPAAMLTRSGSLSSVSTMPSTPQTSVRLNRSMSCAGLQPSRGSSIRSVSPSSTSPGHSPVRKCFSEQASSPPRTPQGSSLGRKSKKEKNKQRFSTEPTGGGYAIPEEAPPKNIQRCDNFDDIYCLKGEVMPSIHRGMAIHFAYKRSDPEKNGVVVKTRNKALSFPKKSDEMAWRVATEFTLEVSVYPGIARVLDVYEDDETYFVVMEKVNGLDLHDMLQKEGRVSTEQAKDVFRQLMGALEKLHSRGYTHNDIKLENVMIESLRRRRSSGTKRRSPCLAGGIVKLIDFDTLKEVNLKSPPVKQVVGTDQYIAPEAYKGFYTPASDVFAAGVILYRLLTNSFPFDDNIFKLPGNRNNTVGVDHMECLAERVSSYNIDWSHAVFEAEPGAKLLVSKMLHKNLVKRPPVTEIMRDTWLLGIELSRSPA
eukprot:TRINITY_DN12856_c0_g1_i5.p1 TRINITY_DN12856_c0_g1~~TRINITY_DN12856_c0_g1_i5.p1  ORF type:complete len:466 (+),score=85.71 TRINITY_DN12856_c0_g1_i5:90-1487(+)